MTQTPPSQTAPFSKMWMEDAIAVLESGIAVDSIGAGDVIEIRTGHRTYTLRGMGGQQAAIEGHPLHCPKPVVVMLVGSTWGGSLLRPRFLGCGMHLEYFHPELGLVRTSKIREIKRLEKEGGRESGR